MGQENQPGVPERGKYIVKHCVQDGVIRHLLINEYQDGSVKTRIYHQEDASATSTSPESSQD